MNKDRQRKICLNNRNNLSFKYKKEASSLICSNLLSLITEDNILSYMPTKEEVDISEFNKLKNAAYPVTISNNLSFYKTNNFIEGKFHILEPDINKSSLVDLEDYHFIIVPLVGFDQNCHRLGHGGGYYDRFLKDKKLIKIGVGYEAQKLDSIIFESHDQKLDYVVTEKCIYKK